MRTPHSLGEHVFDVFTTSDPITVEQYVVYYLWDSSASTLASIGIPTEDDINQWIQWLEHRDDSGHTIIQDVIRTCIEYLNLNSLMTT